VSQDLANMAWAYAVFCIRNDPLLEAISAAARPKINDFNPQNLANTSWSFEELWGSNDPLMHAISAAAIKRISEFET
jgi:hypothetical protein